MVLGAHVQAGATVMDEQPDNIPPGYDEWKTRAPDDEREHARRCPRESELPSDPGPQFAVEESQWCHSAMRVRVERLP